jgi:hypothetical protein
MTIIRTITTVSSIALASCFASAGFAQAPKEAAPKAAQVAKPQAVASTDTQPTLLGQYGDWGAYTASPMKHEVSVIIGYPFKAESDATAEIGSTKFAMYTQNDGAWIKNVAEEARMIDAMRKGADLTVKGTSGRGTVSTDTYSLKGLAQAIVRVDQECK